MDSIRDHILARPELNALRAARDIDALAAAVNAAQVPVVQSRYITARTILAECADGAAILDALTAAGQSISAVKWALTFLSQDSGLDVGHPATLAMIDQLVAAQALQPNHGEALRVLALVPNTVTRDQVNAAMFNPDGTEKS